MISPTKNNRLFLLCALLSSTTFLRAELPQKPLDSISASIQKPNPQAPANIKDSAMNVIQKWWQQSVGGYHAQMEQRSTLEVPAEKTFDDVIGFEPFKERLTPAIAYAQDPAKYTQIGSDIITNFIFYGVKCSGKSFFANAVAGEMKKVNPQMRILNVPCALFAALGVQETIDLIRTYAPCVAFVDEIDIVGPNRGIDRESTAQLLKAMGKGNISPSSDKPVFLIFATNKLESIDTSLASLGQFVARILFTPPSFIDRIQFMNVILQTAGQNPENFDLQRLAEKTESYSFEDIKYCIKQAALVASLRNTPFTTELIVDAGRRKRLESIQINL